MPTLMEGPVRHRHPKKKRVKTQTKVTGMDEYTVKMCSAMKPGPRHPRVPSCQWRGSTKHRHILNRESHPLEDQSITLSRPNARECYFATGSARARKNKTHILVCAPVDPRLPPIKPPESAAPPRLPDAAVRARKFLSLRRYRLQWRCFLMHTG